ncbi:MAG: cytidine deaminase [Deltaproteobacteria bacterium]|nr:cytidine deaminase [Deltaproteobacteria bacterium]
MTPRQQELLEQARQAAYQAYAPYSRFRVGAAVLADGKIYSGANVENASYGLALCAERAALAHARVHGGEKIEGIAVYCLDAPADESGAIPQDLALPCGACRQWLAELAPEAWLVTNASPTPYRVADLLPHPFRLTR